MSFGFGFALPAYPLRGGGGNNPFNQSGPTLDLSFAGVVTDNTDPNGYTLTTNFITPQYQVAAQYTIWETGVGLVDKTFSQIITFTRASTATFTGSNGLIQSAAIDAPRFDYDPVTLAAKGLLIEEQRTNLLTYSEQFDNAAWNKGTGGSIAANTVVAPDGTVTADAYTWATSTAAFAFLSQAVSSVSTNPHTYSLWLKRPTGTGSRTVRLSISDITTSSDNSSSFTVTESWQRFSFTRTSATSTGQVGAGLNGGLTGTPIAAGEVLEVWGAQLETGSFATSYIPTVASQVTRSADVASVNTLSPWYNATEGTLYAEFTPYGVTPDVRFAAIDDNTSANRILIWGSSSSSSTRYEVITGGVSQVNNSVSSTLTANATTKSAAAYKVNDFAFSVNGGVALTDTTGTVPAVTKLTIGGSAGATMSYGAIRRITYYPRRLSNAELQAITA